MPKPITNSPGFPENATFLGANLDNAVLIRWLALCWTVERTIQVNTNLSKYNRLQTAVVEGESLNAQ